MTFIAHKTLTLCVICPEAVNLRNTLENNGAKLIFFFNKFALKVGLL